MKHRTDVPPLHRLEVVLDAEQRAHVWESRAKAWRAGFHRIVEEIAPRENESIIEAIRRLKGEVAHG